MSFAITPKAKGDEEKVGHVAAPADRGGPDAPPRVATRRRASSCSPGMSQMHVEVAVERLKRRFGVEVELHQPRIAYRETIKKKGDAQGRYKKQTGGRGQFGDCWIRLVPLPRGSGYEFADQITGGVIPNKFIPAVDKGIQEALAKGVIAGYPVVDLRVELYDGSYHTVDSSEMAFKIAGSMAFQNAARESDPILLEPVMDVTVYTPDEYLGDVIGDLNQRRGRIMGMEPSTGGKQKVRAHVPQGELYRYSTTLRSITQGRGDHARAFYGYEEVPAHIAEKIIDETKREREEVRA